MKTVLQTSLFELQLDFHALMILENCIQKKLLSILLRHSSDVRLAYTVQIVGMVWRTCTWAAGQSSIHIAWHSYMLCHYRRVVAEGTGSHEQGYYRKSQGPCYAIEDSAVEAGKFPDMKKGPQMPLCQWRNGSGFTAPRLQISEFCTLFWKTASASPWKM